MGDTLNQDLTNNHLDFNEQPSPPHEEIGEPTRLEKPIGGALQPPQPEQPLRKEGPSTSDRLKAIVARDQEYRTTISPERLQQIENNPEERQRFTEEMDLADKVNRVAVQAMIDNGELETPNDFHQAALIFQHGETSTDIKQAFTLSKEAVTRGLPPPVSLVSQSFDRYRTYVQRERGIPFEQATQRFGTQQYQDSAGEWHPYAIDGQATPEELQFFNLQPTDPAVEISQDTILASLTEKLDQFPQSKTESTGEVAA